MDERVPPLTPSTKPAALLLGAAIVLVPWSLALGYRLPAEHTSHHWDVAWAGFDVALAATLAATGIGLARRALWANAAAVAAATLLLCDAWFDNVLANGGGEHLEAALEAALVEVPLALLCLWLARHAEQAVAAVLAARAATARAARGRGARAAAGGAPAARRGARARRSRRY